MTRHAPSTRLLAACVVGLALLLASLAGIDRVGAGEGLLTRLGSVSLPQLAAVILAMGVAGAVARTGFAWIAVGLVAATGIASMLAAWWLAPAGLAAPATWIVRHYGLALVLQLGVAWLAAHAGERLAQRAIARRESSPRGDAT